MENNIEFEKVFKQGKREITRFNSEKRLTNKGEFELVLFYAFHYAMRKVDKTDRDQWLLAFVKYLITRRKEFKVKFSLFTNSFSLLGERCVQYMEVYAGIRSNVYIHATLYEQPLKRNPKSKADFFETLFLNVTVADMINERLKH
jgi:hypothetical protein